MAIPFPPKSFKLNLENLSTNYIACKRHKYLTELFSFPNQLLGGYWESAERTDQPHITALRFLSQLEIPTPHLPSTFH